jgi:transcriptional regulator with XRE-family HTH domain
MDDSAFKKHVAMKIKELRNIKGWTRQQAADKLEMSVAGYGNIERGDTDISITRLAQIAEMFGISLVDLLTLNEKTIFNFSGTHNNDCCHNWQVNSSSNEAEKLGLKNELEKCQLIQQAQEKEIENLKQQIVQLQEIIALLKKEAC